MTQPLLLIDGSSYFFRAFHALPPLVNSKGQPTGAIYGVVNMVKRLLKDYQTDRIAVVFDAKGTNFRNDWYPLYKANRSATPPDLSRQFQPLVDVLTAMGLPLLIIDGVEADDVIGTLAQQATVAQQEVVISTSDKDMTQLVNEHITLIDTMSNRFLDRTGVQQKFGVAPAQIIDYLALVGDTVDNIPGVAKCGPKTAVKWLTDYQSLENLMAHANDIPGKVGENLRETLEHLPLYKKLVTIKTDVELPLDINELVRGEANLAQLITLTQELEFKTWLKELLKEPTPPDTKAVPPVHSEATTARDVVCVRSQQALERLIKKLNNAPLCSFIIEATHSEPMLAEILGFAFALADDQSAYIPIGHPDDAHQLTLDCALRALTPFLTDPTQAKISKNSKFDYSILQNYGIRLQGVCADTMLLSYVINSTATHHELNALTLKYSGEDNNSFLNVPVGGRKARAFKEYPAADFALYAAACARSIVRVYKVLTDLLLPSLHSVFHSIEMPLAFVLARVERAGVLINTETLLKHGLRLKERIVTLEQAIYDEAKRPFNINSPKQLQEILFDELHLPVIAKTPKGQASTAESVLQELGMRYELPAKIIEYRTLNKLVSTYIDALPKRINKTTGRIHTCYNQAVAATGRLSSSEPNLQNIPIRSEEGRLIRKAFVAAPGTLLLAADYSQIELRIMAHLSADPNLVKAFANQWDVHAATASEIFETPLEQVSSEQRRRAKAVNFGLIYGMSAFGLAKQLGIDRHDAQQYMRIYFERYPGVLAYMEETRAQAHEQGFVETLFGRRLYLPEINAQNIMRRRAAERMAINAPMQGTAADIIKKAMLTIAAWQDEDGAVQAPMIMQVHDELLFEIPCGDLKSASTRIKHLMETAASLSVPLEVSMGHGSNWDEAH